MFGVLADATANQAVVTGLTDAAGQVTANVTGVLPVVLPVLGILIGITVAIRFGRKLLKSG